MGPTSLYLKTWIDVSSWSHWSSPKLDTLCCWHGSTGSYLNLVVSYIVLTLSESLAAWKIGTLWVGFYSDHLGQFKQLAMQHSHQTS